MLTYTILKGYSCSLPNEGTCRKVMDFYEKHCILKKDKKLLMMMKKLWGV